MITIYLLDCKQRGIMRKYILITLVLFFTNCIITNLPDDLKNLVKKNQSKSLLPLIALGGVTTNSEPQSTKEVSAVIGQEGGTIETADGILSLEIPVGALPESRVITITTNATPIGKIPEEYQSDSEIIKFEPEGLRFDVPVRLAIRYPQTKMEEDKLEENFLKFAYINDDGSIEETVQISKDKTNNTIVVEIPHFSFGTLLKSQVNSVNTGQSDITFVTKVANSVISELKKYKSNGYNNVGQYFRSQIGSLGPFLMRLVEVLGTDPVSAAFPEADFDGDGIRNAEDPYALSPVNIILESISKTLVSGASGDEVILKWYSKEKSSPFTIRLNGDSCETGLILSSGAVEWNVPTKGSGISWEENNTKTFILSNSVLNIGNNIIRICVLKNGIYGFAAKSIIKDVTKPSLTINPESGTYGKVQTITVNCQDEGNSTCGQIIYTTDGSSPRFPRKTLSMVVPQIGKNYTGAIVTPSAMTSHYKFLAQDLAGNESSVKNEDYYIDSIAPSIRINSVQPSSLISIGTSPTIDWQSDRNGTFEIKI